MRSILLHIRTHLRWYLLLFLITCSILLWSIVIRENRSGVLTVTFLNVGQGNATFIESPTGVQVIIDGGPNKILMREISAVKPWYDRHVDALIVTNPDRDHYEGFFGLLDKYSVDVFMESGIQDTSAEFKSLQQKLSNKKIPDILARRGQVIDIGGGAYIKILFPDRDVSGLASNNASIVARLVYGNTSLLLQGDSPQAMENYLASLDSADLKSDLIEVGHHGSRTSSSDIYIKAVSPKYAIISAETGNSYGHPHKETLEVLDKFGVQTLATCKMGRITFESDGKMFVLKNRNITPVSVGCK